MKPSLSQNQKASAKLTCEGGSLGEVEVNGEADGVGIGVCICDIRCNSALIHLKLIPLRIQGLRELRFNRQGLMVPTRS